MAAAGGETMAEDCPTALSVDGMVGIDEANTEIRADSSEGDKPEATKGTVSLSKSETGGPMHMQVCVSWVTGLETVAVHQDGVIADIAQAVMPNVPANHKCFIYRGLLLQAQTTVANAKLHEGCVLHMVLSEVRFQGRPLHVRRIGDDVIFTLTCSPNFSISEVKHELACFPNERPPAQMRLAYAGRELEDAYTLRQYNIQKPSVLLLLAEPIYARGLHTFVAKIEPQRDAIGVQCDAPIVLQFKRVIEDESHFWGQMLGSPDIHSLSLLDFQVTCVSVSTPPPHDTIRSVYCFVCMCLCVSNYA